MKLWFDGLNRLRWAYAREGDGFEVVNEVQEHDRLGGLSEGEVFHCNFTPRLNIAVKDTIGNSLDLEIRKRTLDFAVPRNWRCQLVVRGMVRLVPRQTEAEVAGWD